MEADSAAGVRLSQLVDATGLSALVIRAWERRYGFPSAVRTPGGHRRYTTTEAAAVQRAAMFVRAGFRPLEAIRRAQSTAPAISDRPEPDLVALLIGGDPVAAIARLRGLEVTVGFEQALVTAALPAMRAIGERWEHGEGGIADEHVATAVVQSWMGLVRSELPDPPAGAPVVMVASAPGELHDLPALILEALLVRRGVQAVSIGANLPPATVLAAARERKPQALVVSCVHRDLDAGQLAALLENLRESVPGIAIYVGGPGPRPAVRARELPLDLLQAADQVAVDLVRPEG